MLLNAANKGEKYLHYMINSPSSEMQGSHHDMITIGRNSRNERESIHSGQFMVSHFEAEEAQDDLEGSEVKMLDLEDPNLTKVDDVNTCTEIQLYVPRTSSSQRGEESQCLVTSHLEIETSLTKLFKCMTLAYSQKLTSPKWNHFKGVRLRWKDKIRLNNVIWRCWHMQFILKYKTPVCQFASPLDVDVHSNPQSVVLEGKYWKRQLTVIKAEYRKWRRNFKSNTTECLPYDSKSEFDFLEWSPLNDRSLILNEDWTTDTLFSTINGPFPFPDPREIARSACIADFIQPSLGPLQPNLDDIDITFSELLQNSRLPSVPEEGADEVLKSTNFEFSPIMSSEQIDSAMIMDIGTSRINEIGHSDTNMIALDSTPLETLPFSDIVSYTVGENDSTVSSAVDAVMNGEPIASALTKLSPKQNKHIATFETMMARQNNSDYINKSVIKGRVSKTFQRSLRREPHNYDKVQPTLHQTTLYHQMLADQQKSQQILQTQQIPIMYSQTQQRHQQLHFDPSQQCMPTQFLNNCDFNSDTLSNNAANKVSDIFNASVTVNSNNKDFALIQEPSLSQINKTHTLRNIKSDMSSLCVNNLYAGNNLNEMNFINDTQCNVYNMSPNVSIKKPSMAGIDMESSVELLDELPQYLQEDTVSLGFNEQMPSLSKLGGLKRQGHVLGPQHVTLTPMSYSQHPQQTQMPKEMFRSNSLPLNVSLHKVQNHENFIVPKSHTINKATRKRSNSIHHNRVNCSSNISQQLQTAASEPMLNSTLAQLLVTNTCTTTLRPPIKQHSSSTSSIPTIKVPINSTNSVGQNKPISNLPSLPTSNHKSNLSPSFNLFNSSMQSNASNVATHTITQIKEQYKSPKKSLNAMDTTTSTVPLMINIPQGNQLINYCVDPAGHSSSFNNNQAILSPDSFHDQDSSISPTHGGFKVAARDIQRRAGHIHAEQKRRYNIKNGFDLLFSLIPQLQQNPNAKLSKAAMLQKGADHIKLLRSERNQLKLQIEALYQERDELNNSLTHLHSILPATGAPVSRQGSENIRHLYEQYVQICTTNNWKFWILGLIMEPLLNSYTSSVSSTSIEELRRSAFLWVDQHCSMIDLRPAVSNKLKYLSMKTDILSDPPTSLEDEVIKAVQNNTNQHPNLHGV